MAMYSAAEPIACPRGADRESDEGHPAFEAGHQQRHADSPLAVKAGEAERDRDRDRERVEAEGEDQRVQRDDHVARASARTWRASRSA